MEARESRSAARDAIHEIANLDVERACQPRKNTYAGITPSALKPSQLGRIHLGPIRQRLLRQLVLKP